MSEGIHAVLKLSEYLRSLPSDGRSSLCDFVYDIGRFVRHSRPIIEKAPLQVYVSALIYSPEQSLVRKQYEHAIPNWIVNPPTIRKTWSPLQQSFENRGWTGVALSPNGKLVASATVEIWDTSTGTLLHTLDPLGRQHTVTFSHGDSKEIISLSSEGNLRKWEVSLGRLIKELKNPAAGQPATHTQIFSHDKTRSATYFRLSVIGNFKPHKSEILYWAFSPNGDLVATISEKGSVRVWNTSGATLNHEFKIDDNRKYPIGSVVFSHLDDVMAASLGDKIFIWCLKEHRFLNSFPAKAVKLSFSSSSRYLISFGGLTEEINWWDWTSENPIPARTVHTGSFQHHLSPNGELLVFANESGSEKRNQITVLNSESGGIVQALDGCTSPAEYFSFSDDGVLMATTAFHDVIRLWDLTGPVIHGQLERFPLRCVNRLYLAPDYQTVAVIGDRIRLWNLRTNTAGEEISSDACYETLFSPDGGLFASATGWVVRIWSVDTGETLCELPDYSSPLKFTFSPKGDLLAQVTWEGSFADLEPWCESEEDGSDEPTPSRNSHPEDKNHSITIWERSGNQVRPVLKGPGHSITSLAFSPDSKFLATAAASERGLLIWDLISLNLIETRPPISPPEVASEDRRLDIDDDSISDFDIGYIVWSPDNTRLASICTGGTILLWDTATWTLTSHSNKEHSFEDSIAIAFSPDGKLLASAWCKEHKPGIPYSFRGQTKLWEVQNGLLSLIGTRDFAASKQSLRFTTDGTAIETDIGRVDVRSFYPESEPTSSSRDLRVAEDEWAVVGNEKILLPLDYRATCATALDGLLMIGHGSGQVSVFQVKEPGN
ncbi:quinon protein alcohol dehydrogenase-like superfamily [Aspergillus karnatakaensis]|uniref:WD40 repeat domain-containing protein n=1 Tax=Aspergillus karnatakaensis TaxID=1810916 RepID=UPI003CCDD512